MSVWQIVSDADSFRWEVAARSIHPDSESTPTSPPDSTSLPSMSDLLLQGCSKLLEPDEAVTGELTMFRTGLGKPVALKHSSIDKAMPILSDDKIANSEHLHQKGFSDLQEREADGVGNLPLFRTASGKSVQLKESSITKALSVLGDDNMADTGSVCSGKSVGFSNCFFQTGSGKKVNVSSAGLERAKALLGLEQDGLDGFNHVKDLSSSHPQKQSDAASGPSLSGTLKQYDCDFPRQPPIKFQTAGGKALSVSSDALKRARSLLGDLDESKNFFDVAADDQFFTPQKDHRSDKTAINSGSGSNRYLNHHGTSSEKHTSNRFISPLRSSTKQFRCLPNPRNLASGNNLINKFDAAVEDEDCAQNVTKTPMHELSHKPSTSDITSNDFKENTFSSRNKPFRSQGDGPLADITNYGNNKQSSNEKKRLGHTTSVSPFKRPRSSTFHTPLKKTVQHAPSGLSTVSSYTKRVLSTRYTQRIQRVYIKEYFGMHPSAETKMHHLPDHIRRITSSNAHKYLFDDKSGSNMIGAEAFLCMLIESGASLQHASIEWVTNHYRLVVWKLACYEKYYPAKCAGKFLTIPNVLEELKYRYEREVNHGHCSAIKRILSGDAPASSMMVLCVSAIPKINNDSRETNGSADKNNMKVEVTDGWYTMDAALDVMLTKQLSAGKLFVGQKLRIWGAGLSGWAAPTSPLEAVNTDTICLLLNMNGTYRAHWADRLGFCKGVGPPLAFSCIKSKGGPVPTTLAGITRMYPILYKERLRTGKSVVRSERAESNMVQQYNQRRSALIEGLMYEHQRGMSGFHGENDSESEEGAKVFKLLENSAEPEVLMAEMSPEQLTSFTLYKTKVEEARQREMEKCIAKAVEDAELGERDVSQFMRIRVVGLSKPSFGIERPKEGIVTIWNPTEKQKRELKEGHIYIIKGLVPMTSDSDTLYLQARGPSTRWQPLSPSSSDTFRPFFNPREPTCLSNLGEIPLSSEFDIAAYVVYVGEVYGDVMQKKQWVFVADGSGPLHSHSQSDQISNNILAISFSSPYIDDNSSPQISYNLAGSTVRFCNLIKREKDKMNQLWVAEATENSVYFLNLDSSSYCSHLRNARDDVQTWAHLSSSVRLLSLSFLSL